MVASWLAWFVNAASNPGSNITDSDSPRAVAKGGKADFEVVNEWDESALLKDETKPLPWPVFKIATGLLVLVQRITHWLVPAPLTLTIMTLGYMRSQILYTVAKLRIAEVLAAGPLSTDQLARHLGADPARMARLMNAAAEIGLFKKIKLPRSSRQPLRYCNNRLTATLRQEHPNSVQNLVLHLHDHAELAWLRLPTGIRTGESMFETAYGKPMFDFLGDDPKEEAKFSNAMSELNHMGSRTLMEDFSWGEFRRIVDIGGAYGGFLRMIMESNQGVQGVIFDQPQVIAEAPAAWLAQPDALRHRVRFQSGDFFEPGTIPKAQNGDAFLLREILHDWDDANALKILQGLRTAIGSSNAVLILAENVQLGVARDLVFNRAVLDLHMMVSLNGAERTKEQHSQLLSQAGFRLQSIAPTRCIFSLITAVPV